MGDKGENGKGAMWEKGEKLEKGKKGEKGEKGAFVAITRGRTSSPRANIFSKMGNQINATGSQDSATSATIGKNARTNTRTKQSKGTQQQPPK